MNIKRIILSLFLSLFSISIFAGGGWPKKKGKYYFKLSGWYLESDEHFGPKGGTDDNLTAGLFNFNLYGEYGLTDRLTALAYFPFFSRAYFNEEIINGTTNSGAPGEDLNSVGDTQLGVKYGLFQNDIFSLSGSFILDFPLGKTGEGVNQSLATGDGEFNQIIRADLGISLYNSDNLSLYGNVYSGVNIRSKDFSEEFRGGVELGAGFFDKKLWVVGKFDTIQSFNNGDRDFNTANSSGVFINNVEITTITPEVNYYITDKIGVSVATSIPLDGQFAYTKPSYTGGVFIDVK